MSDNDDSIWGSLTDSMMNKALENNVNHQQKHQQDVEIPTDPDDKVEQRQDLEIPTDPDANNGENDWTTLNDSQFITFINKISQTHVGNTTNIIPDTSPFQPPNKPISHIHSSPIQLAQQQPTVIDSEDAAVSDILSNADDYAFADHEGYFAVKARKQAEQGEQLAAFLQKTSDGTSSTSTFNPHLFRNCRIHVNGRTEPDVLQLRQLIVKYGGVYVHHMSSKGSVTHIIAESLPPRKRIQFGNCKVVTPKWILESIESGKVLDWSEYRLQQLGDYGQTTIGFKKTKENVIEDLEEDDVEEVGEVEENDHDITPIVEEPETNETPNEEIPNETTTEVDDLLSQELSRRRIDANHPDFLSVFFAKSRLHHLSTWKADLQSKFLNMAILKLKNVSRDSQPTQKIILHVDFDCFFATVSAKFESPPVDINNTACCVTHGGASADIASCNYVARKFGVRNGMWMSRARKLCPGIVTMPYQFDAYENISNLFYKHLMSLQVDSILPVSIDEALVDISTMCENKSVLDVVKSLKSDLDKITGCSLSLGVGKNVLLAKLALRKAKPNGVYVTSNEPQQLETFLNDISVRDLPGFGDKLFQKLRPLFYNATEITLHQLRMVELSKLSSTFGLKMGEKLYNYCRGIDDTSIDVTEDPEKYQRKSLNIDVNWGIRFQTDPEVEIFLHRIAGELCKRLVNIDMIGSMLTLKLSVRHPEAPIEPAKYMGMGRCNFFSKSSKLGVSTREVGVVSSELKYLWRYLNIKPQDLRGVGVGMTKLQKADKSSVNVDNQMKLDFGARPKKKEEKFVNIIETKPELKPVNESPKKHAIEDQLYSTPKKKRPATELLSDAIDWDVFELLPPDMQAEIKEELRRRNLQASPRRPKVFRKNDIANLLSPRKQTPQKESSGVFQFVSPEKIAEQRNKSLLFQGISISEENAIIEKLIYWMDFTLVNDDSFDEKDLSLFNDFMIKLVNTNEILLLVRIYESMKFHLNFCADQIGHLKWQLVLENLDQLIKEQSFTKLEFTF